MGSPIFIGTKPINAFRNVLSYKRGISLGESLAFYYCMWIMLAGGQENLYKY